MPLSANRASSLLNIALKSSNIRPTYGTVKKNGKNSLSKVFVLRNSTVSFLNRLSKRRFMVSKIYLTVVVVNEDSNDKINVFLVDS